MVGYGTELQLSESRTITLRSDGTGEIFDFGPFTQFEKWVINVMQTVCNSASETELIVYRRNHAIAGTYSGNFDTNDSRIVLHPGERLSFRYSNGSAGSIATVTLDGERWLRGRLAY